MASSRSSSKPIFARLTFEGVYSYTSSNDAVALPLLDDFCKCRLAYPAALDFFKEFLGLDGPGLDDLTLADIFV